MRTVIVIGGMCILILIAYIFSIDRKSIKIKPVIGAFIIQATIGGVVLYVPAGQHFLSLLTRAISAIIEFSNHGIHFLFGDLNDGKNGFIFAFQVLPIIIFFSSLMSVLYYLGVMQKIASLFGASVKYILGTSKIESTAAASNIFVGNVDVFIMVKPYVKYLTNSELFAVMTGGFASIAGSVLVGYAAMGIDINILLTAAFMSAPAGLLFAKLIYPETEEVKDFSFDVHIDEVKPVNIIEAATSGALVGLKVAASVGVMLLALVSLIAMLNSIISLIIGAFGPENITLQQIFGYVFSPFAWLLGIPKNEVLIAGDFLGQKLVLNEFVAFLDFSKNRELLSPDSQTIIIMALAGFANLSAPAAMLGVLGNFAPERKGFIAKMALRVILGSTLANMMSAAIISLYISMFG